MTAVVQIGIVNGVKKRITFIRDLSEIQRQRLLHMANRKPVHRLVSRTIKGSSTHKYPEGICTASAEV